MQGEARLEECEGGRVDDFITRAAEELRDDGRARNLQQERVIDPVTTQGILHAEHTLYLVRLHHRFQHRAHGERRFPRCGADAAQMIRHGENRADIVRRVRRLRGDPRVVEVEPAHEASGVECRRRGIELIRRARHARPVRDHGAGDSGT